ncbi:ASCH domain-containing protein [Streptomyces sp. H10-C2]|uniref:ASCH domain-containing protein n=1 Tax=unclassified Streptomyces TaxID=2593676 RepID=UPI0024BA16A3|nr:MULTISPECIES: ASCH domain-containing protein [unclassified Streptomyces]MDJ0342203.1 ASCH domain-containing protein [Streptomyces sp. PH10-H1]MDJ0368717.1 ASCH domain-containing protein [Streptomyces sp. H10-C2]
MKALTIRQPWADAIAHQTKRLENRTWKTNYRGLVLIHAAAAPDRTAIVYGPRPDTRSAVIATARISDCHYSDDGRCCGPWGDENVYHWTLTDVSTLPEPVPCKGRLGLWTPAADIVTAVLEQEREAVR